MGGVGVGAVQGAGGCLAMAMGVGSRRAGMGRQWLSMDGVGRGEKMGRSVSTLLHRGREMPVVFPEVSLVHGQAIEPPTTAGRKWRDKWRSPAGILDGAEQDGTIGAGAGRGVPFDGIDYAQRTLEQSWRDLGGAEGCRRVGERGRRKRIGDESRGAPGGGVALSRCAERNFLAAPRLVCLSGPGYGRDAGVRWTAGGGRRPGSGLEVRGRP